MFSDIFTPHTISTENGIFAMDRAFPELARDQKIFFQKTEREIRFLGLHTR